MKKRTAAQKRAEWERKNHSEEFIQWTQRQPSVASGEGPCVCHHTRPDTGLPSGTSRKPDACWIVPLTDEEHKELHGGGERTFESRWGINLADKAREHWAKWRELEE